MKKNRILLLVLFVLVLIAGLVWINHSTKIPDSPQVVTLKKSPDTDAIAQLVINNKNITVEVVAREEVRQKGLMDRRELAKDHGMLFVYAQERQLSFWMQNTYLPLSIAFIKANGLISEIRPMKPLSEEIITSSDSAKYALEMIQGWFKQNNIKPGDRVAIPTAIKTIKADE